MSTDPNAEAASKAGSTPDSNGTQLGQRPGLLTSEDWWAVWIGGMLLLICLVVVTLSRPEDFAERLVEIDRQSNRIQQVRTELRADASDNEADINALDEIRQELKQQEELLKTMRADAAPNPLKQWLAKPASWEGNPLHAFFRADDPVTNIQEKSYNVLPGILGVLVVALLVFSMGSAAMGRSVGAFCMGFVFVFLLATIAYVLAGQKVVKHYNLEYALWALAIGLLISNTIGTPRFARSGAKTEFFIKTGLVILGAEVLFSRLLTLGVPGIFVAWVVTPIVLVSTYIFGQRVLKLQSRSLNMVISADMSVCGVSAAIATAAACKAKKEELSLAIGMSLTFTVIMMVALPALIRTLGISDVLGGAWLGGTIDATGAVAAAGGILGESALQVAATVKMIQNILIGVVAFCVALYWVLYVERSDSGAKPSVMEIWYRFPKFVIGFVAASVLFSIVYSRFAGGDVVVDAVIKNSTKTLRGWFFCLAFVSIGLETNYRELAQYLKGGKPLVLYLVGQSLNIILTLLMAWLMFEVIFDVESIFFTN